MSREDKGVEERTGNKKKKWKSKERKEEEAQKNGKKETG